MVFLPEKVVYVCSTIDHVGLSRPLSLALNDAGSEFRIAPIENQSKLPSDSKKKKKKNGGLERRLGVQSEHQCWPQAVLHRLCLPLIRWLLFED